MTDVRLDDNQKAVVAKYGFEIVKLKKDSYQLSDPLIRAAVDADSPVGIVKARTVGAVLKAAVEMHDSYVARNGSEPLPVEDDEPEEAIDTGTDETSFELDTEDNEKVVETNDEPEPVVDNVVPLFGKPAEDQEVSSELVAASFDDTGKRAKPMKKEKAPKKDVRFVRMYRAILDGADTAEKVSVAANIGVTNAQYDGLGSFAAYTAVLVAGGKMKPLPVMFEVPVKNVYTRASTVIAANPDITPEELSGMLDKVGAASARWCTDAWKYLHQVLAERKLLLKVPA